MAYYAAILHTYRPQHLAYLESLKEQGKIFAMGPFADGAGGLVIDIADSLEEAKEMAEKDPYVVEGVRRLEMHEWKRVRLSSGFARQKNRRPRLPAG
jgi:uncharacterized protein YciI